MSLGGQTKTVYASYYDSQIENNARTISNMCYILKSDDEFYSLLTAVHKQIVDKYYDLYIKP